MAANRSKNNLRVMMDQPSEPVPQIVADVAEIARSVGLEVHMTRKYTEGGAFVYGPLDSIAILIEQLTEHQQ